MPEYSEILSAYRGGNPLLVHAPIGMAKPSTHDLPPLQHVFGKPNDRSQPGAGDLTNKWQQHVNSEKDKLGYDSMRLNKICANRKLSFCEIKEFRG